MLYAAKQSINSFDYPSLIADQNGLIEQSIARNGQEIPAESFLRTLFSDLLGIFGSRFRDGRTRLSN
jgi:hypothetical protein